MEVTVCAWKCNVEKAYLYTLSRTSTDVHGNAKKFSGRIGRRFKSCLRDLSTSGHLPSVAPKFWGLSATDFLDQQCGSTSEFRAGSRYGFDNYLKARCGMRIEATLHLLRRGVRLTDIDAWELGRTVRAHGTAICRVTRCKPYLGGP